MKDKRDIVDKAINALKNEPVGAGPPKEVLGLVAGKLSEAGARVKAGASGGNIKIFGLMKAAVAAALLIVAGYTVARLTTPLPPDTEQLHHALESSLKSSLTPAIREELLEELEKRWQLALAGSYVQLTEELRQQLRNDMNEFGMQILTASGVVTNQRLRELIEAVNTAQSQERRWFAAALGQIELNRRVDTAQLRNDLATFAVQTGDELVRTKQEVARWVEYGCGDISVPDESKDFEQWNERSRK